MIEVRACENNIGLGFSMFQPLLEDRNRQITWNLHAKLINLGISPETKNKAAVASENHDFLWLVVYLPLWKICSSVGMIIPNWMDK